MATITGGVSIVSAARNFVVLLECEGPQYGLATWHEAVERAYQKLKDAIEHEEQSRQREVTK